MRLRVSLKVRLRPRVVCIVLPTTCRARRGIIHKTTGGTRVEDLAHASCYVPAVLKVLRDRGEVPRGVPPVWWREREANAGSAESRWLMGSSGLRSQLYVSNIRWVGGCRLVKIDAREGAQVAMVT